MTVQFSWAVFFMLDFKIKSHGIVSRQFLELNIASFSGAAAFVKILPYKRNKNKNDELCVLKDHGGTCSTKHALLKKLANENGVEEIKLFLGIFKMNALNTPKISPVLEKYRLLEIAEAHNYLKYKNEILDFTRKNSKPEDFISDLIEELEIQPEQIPDFKVKYHQKFIEKYLRENPQIPFDMKRFWEIREECIAALQK